MSTGSELTLDRLRDDVAKLLGRPATTLVDDQSLLDQGLDSVRLMSLVGRWRALGATISFAELAERPTLKGWSELIGSQRAP